MSDYVVVPSSALSATADAIKEKLGTQEDIEFTTDGFKDAVEAISTGGGSTLKQELLGYTPAGDVTYIPDENIPRYGIVGKRGMTSLTLDFADGHGFTASNSNGFNIDRSYIPVITIIGRDAGVYLPAYVISDCPNALVVVCRGKITKYTGNVFRGNGGLTALDYTYSSGNGFGANDFFADSSFGTLIIRGSTMMPLSNTSAFSNATKFRSGGAGGILYVPQALISSYEAATNWSTILGYADSEGNPQNQILPIEGSIYETQYADGTLVE